jgi:hypothetical protein
MVLKLQQHIGFITSKYFNFSAYKSRGKEEEWTDESSDKNLGKVFCGFLALYNSEIIV